MSNKRFSSGNGPSQRQLRVGELIRRTHLEAGLDTTLILLSAPKAQTYYPHIGMTKHESCWITPRIAPPDRKTS